MKKYKVTGKYVTATLEGTVEADNEEEAKEKFLELDADKIDEYPCRDTVDIEAEELSENDVAIVKKGDKTFAIL